MKNILEELIKSKEGNKSFYNQVKADFTFNSSSIEGSTVSYIDNEKLVCNDNYDHTTIKEFDTKYKSDEVIENYNCGQLFDYVIETINTPLTLNTLRIYHNILKKETEWAKQNISSYGDFKKIPNYIKGNETSQPWEVIDKLSNLIDTFNHSLSLEEICKFHCHFEQIHPYLDGNGRIGRAIMLKQCLESNITPFIINDKTKELYSSGIAYYLTTNKINALEEYVLDCQNEFSSKHLECCLNKKEREI